MADKKKGAKKAAKDLPTKNKSIAESQVKGGRKVTAPSGPAPIM